MQPLLELAPVDELLATAKGAQYRLHDSRFGRLPGTLAHQPDQGLYHEGRTSKAPTAARVFDLFADTARHHPISQDGDIIQVFKPELNDLQRHVLDLLGVPHDTYLSTTTQP